MRVEAQVSLYHKQRGYPRTSSLLISDATGRARPLLDPSDLQRIVRVIMGDVDPFGQRQIVLVQARPTIRSAPQEGTRDQNMPFDELRGDRCIFSPTELGRILNDRTIRVQHTRLQQHEKSPNSRLLQHCIRPCPVARICAVRSFCLATRRNLRHIPCSFA